MRITFKLILVIMSCLILPLSCGGNRDDNPVVPPVTSPLTSDYIGFGVITDSFTHVNADPSENSESMGYLRRGSLVKVIRRQQIRTPEGFVTWVLIDGEQQGWLKENDIDIYNNERQAKTASDSMAK